MIHSITLSSTLEITAYFPSNPQDLSPQLTTPTNAYNFFVALKEKAAAPLLPQQNPIENQDNDSLNIQCKHHYVKHINI